MIQAIKENFVELLITSVIGLAITCLTVGVSYNRKLEKEQEIEMAKLGCTQKFGPGGYSVWDCPVKDRP